MSTVHKVVFCSISLVNKVQVINQRLAPMMQAITILLNELSKTQIKLESNPNFGTHPLEIRKFGNSQISV